MDNLQLGRIQRWSPVVRPMHHNHHHQDTTNTTCSVRLNVCTCNKDITHDIPRRKSSTATSSADSSRNSTRGVDSNPTLPRRGGSRTNTNKNDSNNKEVSSSSSLNCKPYMERSSKPMMSLPLSLDRSIRTTMSNAATTTHHKNSSGGTSSKHQILRTSPSRSSWPSTSLSSQSDPYNDIAKAMIDLALSTIAEDGGCDEDDFSMSCSTISSSGGKHHFRSRQSFVRRSSSRINNNNSNTITTNSGIGKGLTNIIIRNPIAAHGA